MSVVLEGQGLARSYDVTRGIFAKPSVVQALAGVSFQLEAGKTLELSSTLKAR